MNLYKELNNFTEEKEITTFIERLKDRFGEIPKAINNVCDALRLKWHAKQLGFERIILKNDKMRAYFPSKADSPYYNSDIFKKVLEYIKINFKTCKIIEKKGKLSIQIKNISTLKKALHICNYISKS